MVHEHTLPDIRKGSETVLAAHTSCCVQQYSLTLQNRL